MDQAAGRLLRTRAMELLLCAAAIVCTTALSFAVIQFLREPKIVEKLYGCTKWDQKAATCKGKWIPLHKDWSPIASFLLMPNGEDGDLVAVDAVQDDIAAVAEVDQLLSIFWVHILDRSADAGVLPEDLNARSDRGYGPLGRVGIFEDQEAVEPLNVGQGMRRPDQPWHVGTSASSPASSLASQASASSIVTCSPVS